MLRISGTLVLVLLAIHSVAVMPVSADTASEPVHFEEQADGGQPEVVAENRAADVATGNWLPYLHLTPKIGDERQLGRLNLMYPMTQSWDSMLFADVRLTFDDNDATEGNVGLGFRRMVGGTNNDGWIWGIYGFYDRLRSAHGNRFNQGTFGAELLKTNVELRGNVYIPDNKSHVIGYNAVSSVSLSGTTVIERTLSLEARERSLAGFDVEAGYGFDVGEKDKFWIHGGYFHFDDDDTPEIAGPRLRVQYEWNEAFGVSDSSLALGVEVQEDDVRDTQTFATVTWSIPIGGRRTPRKASGWWRRLESRMTRPIVRDVDVVTFTADITKLPGTSEGPELLSNHDVPLVDPRSNQEVDVYFVTATGGTTGAGTQDDPMTVTQAESAAGASDVIFVLNDDGDIDVSSASGGTLTLKPYQQLLGVGGGTSTNVLLPSNHTLTVSTTSGRPTLTSLSGGNVVTMLWDNRLDGIAVSGGNSGVYGLNVSNPTINDTIIQGTVSNGIYLTNPSGTISISNCVLQGNAGDAIDLRNTAGGAFSLELFDNDISTNGNCGVYFQNINASVFAGLFQNNTIAGNGDQGLYAYNTSGGMATVDIVGNSIVGNSNEGVYLYNVTGGTLTATVRDNLITDSADDNLYCYNNGSTMSVVLNNNDITNSSVDVGVRLYNYATGGMFSGDIENNRITGNLSQGLYLYNTGDSYSATLRNNVITGNQAGGIDYFTDGGATTLTIENNTISNNSGGPSATDDVGITIDQDTGATGTMTLTLTDNSIEGNGYTGLLLDNADGALTAMVTGNSIANNGLYGTYVVNRTTGVLTASFYNNVITENAGLGVWLVNDTGTLNALFESSTMAMNGGDGLELDNVNGGVFDYDLGGGGLGSAGQNSVFANGSGLDIDNDTATSIMAENAWWGEIPPNPARFSGAVDYDPWLTANPN